MSGKQVIDEKLKRLHSLFRSIACYLKTIVRNTCTSKQYSTHRSFKLWRIKSF